MRVWCYDCGGAPEKNGRWGREMAAAVTACGYEARMFTSELQLKQPGFVFVRLAQFPPQLQRDRDMALRLLCFRQDLVLVQDMEQVRAYEHKVYQANRWAMWMPKTWCFMSPYKVEEFLDGPLPEQIVSKAAVGSSSHNVRLLRGKDELAAEFRQAFGEGIPIKVSPGEMGLQKGYLLWQEFIPHDVTYRVTIVGEKLHVYKRFNYPDKPLAAPASVVPTAPVDYGDQTIWDLLVWSRDLFSMIDTKWCAIDVLRSDRGWKLLETSLAWARGPDAAGLSPFCSSKHSLMTQCDLLVEELERGVFGCLPS